MGMQNKFIILLIFIAITFNAEYTFESIEESEYNEMKKE